LVGAVFLSLWIWKKFGGAITSPARRILSMASVS
jgi:hypothetical protein